MLSRPAKGKTDGRTRHGWISCPTHGGSLTSRQNPDAGWDSLYEAAIFPYLTLNLIHCFPELWDPASGRTDATDYRDMRIYQWMVRHCTRGRTTTEVARHPHRQFFGIADRQFGSYGSEYPYGLVTYDKFLASGDERAPPAASTDDVFAVRRLLHRGLGLPMELVLEIMALAEYEPRRRLRVAHDPFHRANRDELDKYISYCWKVLVRCEMMAAAVGLEIDWRHEVSKALVFLLGCGPRRWWRVGEPGDDDEGIVTFK